MNETKIKSMTVQIAIIHEDKINMKIIPTIHTTINFDI